jgi:hypothetical protein
MKGIYKMNYTTRTLNNMKLNIRNILTFEKVEENLVDYCNQISTMSCEKTTIDDIEYLDITNTEIPQYLFSVNLTDRLLAIFDSENFKQSDMLCGIV